MRMLPHAPGMTLTADAFYPPTTLIGFSMQRHQLNVYWHFHDFYELALVTSGTGRHFTSLGERAVQPGSVIFVPPGAGHGYRLCNDLRVYNCFLRSEVAQFELMWTSRDPRLGALFGGRGGEADGAPVVLELDESEMAACIAHLDQVRLREPTDRSAAHDLGHFLLALDVLGRRLGMSPPATERGMAAPAVVIGALELIERDVTHPWSLGELSTRLYVGPHHLCHLFTRWIGQPPMAFVSRRRAELAALLLVSSNDPIAAIGVAVGWPDPSLFSRAFRREHGVSPRAYRLRHRGELLHQTTLVPHRLVHP